MASMRLAAAEHLTLSQGQRHRIPGGANTWQLQGSVWAEVGTNQSRSIHAPLARRTNQLREGTGPSKGMVVLTVHNFSWPRARPFAKVSASTNLRRINVTGTPRLLSQSAFQVYCSSISPN
jgi:hypothetical protein